ncbi:MAG: histidine phosphatase family protein [Cytophagaceae bacterium]|nr:histidine phosphatase family protein [Cytophagaceae bacterium]
MRVLYLVRHAEAEKPAGGPHDFSRLLNPQGMIDSARMGKLLAKKNIKPDALISSPSERTRLTAEVLAGQIGFDKDKIEYAENLYEGAPRLYLAALNALPDAIQSVLLVGHNPAVTYFAEYLTREQLGNMPTSAVAAIGFEGTWAEVSGRTGKLIFYDSPEKLAGYDMK